MDISIVILNYKGKELTLNCLASIASADFNYGDRILSREIILVDNNSGDGVGEATIKLYPEIKFIQNPKNTGMGSGNNLGIRQAIGKYIVIMNPDTTASNEVFVKLYEYMELNDSVGVVGPKQYNSDGSEQDSCYRWPNFLIPIYRRTVIGKLAFAKKKVEDLLMKNFDRNRICEVNWLLGSFLFCRAEALRKIGLFDERYFLYLEDTDLCRSFWHYGFNVIYYPDVGITHNHDRATARVAWYKFLANKAAREHVSSWLKYFWKWKFK